MADPGNFIEGRASLCEQKPAPWFRDGAAQFPRGLEPLSDADFGVGEHFLAGGAVCGATASSGTSAMNAASSPLQYGEDAERENL